MALEVELGGFGALTVAGATVLRHDDLNAANSRDMPDRVAPVALAGVAVTAGRATATLPPASWSVIRLAPISAG